MDDTDERLVTLLVSNPRIHLQDLAEKLGISKQAVHHRMHAMTDAGVICGTTAGISFAYLNAIPVGIFGVSEAPFAENVMNRLGESEFTRRVIVAGGNYFYVVGVLRDLSELDEYADFVKHVAALQNPIVGIYDLHEVPMPDYHVDGIHARKRNYAELSSTDLRIIASLRDDGRRSVAEIAEIAGVTTKTVRRRLDSMTADGSIEFHALVDSPLGGRMLSLMHIRLRKGSDKARVARSLLSKLKALDTYIRGFSNIPDLLVLVFWSDNLRETRATFREACMERDVASVTLNIGYLERIYYSTWRDRLLDTPAMSLEKAGGVQIH